MRRSGQSGRAQDEVGVWVRSSPCRRLSRRLEVGEMLGCDELAFSARVTSQSA